MPVSVLCRVAGGALSGFKLNGEARGLWRLPCLVESVNWSVNSGPLGITASAWRVLLPVSAYTGGMTRTVTYRGPSRGVSAFAHMLEAEGLTARYAPPMEQRGMGDVAEVVVIYLSMKVTDKATDAAMDRAVKAGVSKFRERFGGRGATVEDNGEGG